MYSPHNPHRGKSVWYGLKQHYDPRPDTFEQYCRECDEEWGPDDSRPLATVEELPRPEPWQVPLTLANAWYDDYVSVELTSRNGGPSPLARARTYARATPGPSRLPTQLPKVSRHAKKTRAPTPVASSSENGDDAAEEPVASTSRNMRAQTSTSATPGPSRLPSTRQRAPSTRAQKTRASTPVASSSAEVSSSEEEEDIPVITGTKRRRAPSDDSDAEFVPGTSAPRKKRVKAEPRAASSVAVPSSSAAALPALKDSAGGRAEPLSADSDEMFQCRVGGCSDHVQGSNRKTWNSHLQQCHPVLRGAAKVPCGWTLADGTVCQKEQTPGSRGRHVATVHLLDKDACPVLDCEYEGRTDAVWRHMGSEHGIGKKDRAGAR